MNYYLVATDTELVAAFTKICKFIVSLLCLYVNCPYSLAAVLWLIDALLHSLSRHAGANMFISISTLQIDSSRREWIKVDNWDILTIGMDSFLFVMASINNLIVVVAS